MQPRWVDGTLAFPKFTMTIFGNVSAAHMCAVVRALREELAHRLAANLEIRQKFVSGDRSIETEAIGAACSSAGISLDAYRRCVDADPALAQLEAHAIQEALIGPPDPGP
ncbi:MAG TPA: hypothetical protein VJT73_11955 [Polyangiaceae bacterium]|nr:hypothetical protein [Polyangiaceae bacterium]